MKISKNSREKSSDGPLLNLRYPRMVWAVAVGKKIMAARSSLKPRTGCPIRNEEEISFNKHVPLLTEKPVCVNSRLGQNSPDNVRRTASGSTG